MVRELYRSNTESMETVYCFATKKLVIGDIIMVFEVSSTKPFLELVLPFYASFGNAIVLSSESSATTHVVERKWN